MFINNNYIGKQNRFIDILNNLTDDSYTLRFKNGSKIHIKKKNKGTFTAYCNGKVTNECIRRGKNSSNSAIRKKAIFAENSRKWNHEV